jgi:hypothetical protein
MPAVGELIHRLDNDKALDELARLHQGDGEDPDGYDRIRDVLRELRPKFSDLSVIPARKWSMDEPPEPWVDVSGIQADDPQQYAIEYVEWLSIPIIAMLELQPMTIEEQLAHCLYEMTWSCCTQDDIKEQRDSTLDMVYDIKGIHEKPPSH